MGYRLMIGEQFIDKESYDEYIADGHSEEVSNRDALSVKEEDHDKAPAFGEPTDFSNSRLPSYSSWAYVVQALGVEDLFFDSRGKNKDIKGGHPGFFKIEKEWLDELNKRFKVYKKRYHRCEATYEESHISYNIKVVVERGEEIPVNFALCRLEWLSYWCNYAFDKYGDKAIFWNM